MIASLLKYAPVQIIASLSLFVLIALQTRFLSKEEYGILAVILVVVEVIRAISSQWVTVSLLRLHPSSSAERQKALVASTLFVILGLALPACGFIAVGLYFYKQASLSNFFAFSLLLLVKSLYLYKLELSRLNEDVSSYRKGSILNSLLSILLSFLFLMQESNIISAIMALVISNLSAILILPRFSKIHINIAAIKNIASYGLPIMIAGGLGILATRVDRLFVADFLGMEATGNYAALANMLAGIMGLVFMIVAMPLYPDLTKHTRNKEILFEKHRHYLDLLVAVTFPAFIGICMVAEPLVNLFLTKKYLSDGVELFWLLAISAYLLNFKGHYIDHGLQFLLKTKYMPWISISSILLNIVFLWFLIDKYGVYGAALTVSIVSLIGILISAGLSYIYGYRYYVGVDAIKSIVSSVVMGISIYFVKSIIIVESNAVELFILVFFGILVYFLCVLGLDGFNIKSRVIKGMRHE